MVDCRQPIALTAAYYNPYRNTIDISRAGTFATLTDLQTRTYAPWGVGTAAVGLSTSPHITLTLDAAYIIAGKLINGMALAFSAVMECGRLWCDTADATWHCWMEARSFSFSCCALTIAQSMHAYPNLSGYTILMQLGLQLPPWHAPG